MLHRVDHLGREDIQELLEASIGEGFGIVRKLIGQYESSESRFDKPGELLYTIRDGSIIGVGGLTREPDRRMQGAGRIRRLYVAPSHRGKGYGRLLVTRLVTEGLEHFISITCNVGNLLSRTFYEHLGFVPIQGYSFTHICQGLTRGRGRRPQGERERSPI